MDRAELEERVRQRRPSDPAMRRGRPPGGDAPPADYAPFQPEPEDANAIREEEAGQQPHYVDNTPPDFDEQPAPPPVHLAPPDDHAAAAAAAGYAAASAQEAPPAVHQAEPAPTSAAEPDPYQADPYGPPHAAATHGEAPIDEAPYGAPEDAYPYPYPAEDGGGRGGPGALPIIGFILLGVLALGVGAVLATLFSGNGAVGEASPSPTPTASVAPSEASSSEPSGSASEQPAATSEPTDGPVTFPDGAAITVKACGTADMSFDGCAVDGSTITGRLMWVWIGFDDARATDTIALTLENDGETIDLQEKVLGDVLDCERNGQPICSGYLIGAAYRELEPGEYELVVRRNDDFADSATFRVEG